MLGRKQRRHTVVETLIGPNSKVNGDVHFQGGCHVDGTTRGHIEQNGGYFEQLNMKGPTGKMLPTAPIETCLVCHGEGRTADVREAHRIGEFEVYNVRDND